MNENTMSISRRTLIQRLFPGRLPPAPDFDDDAGQDVLTTTSITVLNWKDKIRVLISGKIKVQISIVLSAVVDPLETVGNFHVLPPNYPLPSKPPMTNHREINENARKL